MFIDRLKRYSNYIRQTKRRNHFALEHCLSRFKPFQSSTLAAADGFHTIASHRVSPVLSPLIGFRQLRQMPTTTGSAQVLHSPPNTMENFNISLPEIDGSNVTVENLKAKFNQVPWAKVRHYAYNTLVFIGVCLYLTFLAAKAVVSAVRTARALWIKYEVSAKITAFIEAIQCETPSTAQRTAEVKQFVSVTTDKATGFMNSLKADYQAASKEFAGK